jgi:hypothetical protein
LTHLKYAAGEAFRKQDCAQLMDEGAGAEQHAWLQEKFRTRRFSCAKFDMML